MKILMKRIDIFMSSIKHILPLHIIENICIYYEISKNDAKLTQKIGDKYGI
jgi:hypothetical protein